jgi:hypothetical protein
MRGDLAQEVVAGVRIEIQRGFRVGDDELQCVGIRFLFARKRSNGRQDPDCDFAATVFENPKVVALRLSRVAPNPRRANQ